MTIPATQALSVQVQTWDAVAAAWVNFGAPVDLGSITRTRRVALSPGQSVTTSKIRVVKIGAFDWTTAVFSIDAVQVFQEVGAPGNVRIWPFTFDNSAQQYMLVATDQNAEVYQRGTHVASIPTPYLDAYIPLVDKTQSLDTMILFHQDVAPWRIERQGGSSQWDSRAVAFDNIPLYDFDGTHLNGVNTVQQIRFVSYVGGDTFNIDIEGNITTAITFSGVDATMEANLQAAVEALPNIGVGGTTWSKPGGAHIYQVEFIGKNAFSDVGEMAPETLESSAGGVFAATITEGLDGGEPMMSDTRGYPRCGCFYQQRLWMGGFLSLPQTIVGSRVGFYFDLQDLGVGADIGVNETIDTDQVTEITGIYPGRHLQVFTSTAEFYFPTEPIIAPAAIKETTQRGSQAGVPQFFMDNATMFVAAAPPDPATGETNPQNGGAAIAEYLFDIYQENYSAGFISTLASHLVNNVVDLGFRKARSTTDMDLALIVQSTGAATLMSALREEEVTAFTPVTTQGAFQAAGGEANGYIYAAVLRAGVLTLERMDPNVLTDCAVQLAGVQSEVTGLPYPDGTLVSLIIDGGDGGDIACAGGTVALPFDSTVSVEAGLNFQPTGTTLAIVLENDQRSGAAMSARTGEIAFHLGPTANLTAGLTGDRQWRVPLKRRPTALLDQGPGQSAFEGWTRVQGVQGFAADAQITWKQDRPGPLQINEIVVNVGT